MRYPLSLKYIPIVGIAVFATFGLHELSHWVAGELLGYNMTLTMNTAYPLGVDDFYEPWHGMVISAAGPLFTILQACVIFAIMRRRKIVALFPFVFVPLIMRILALGVSFSNPNDEARISHDLGLSRWTLPALVCAFLFYLVYKLARRYELNWQFIGYHLLLTLGFAAIVILVIG